jgi:hypothetical protein
MPAASVRLASGESAWRLGRPVETGLRIHFDGRAALSQAITFVQTLTFAE